MCVLVLSMKMILAMTKNPDTCVNKKPEVENDGEEMGDSGRQEVMKNTVLVWSFGEICGKKFSS